MIEVVVVTPLANAALIQAVSYIYHAETFTIPDVYRQVSRRFWTLFGIYLLIGLAIGIPAVIVIFVISPADIPVVYFAIPALAGYYAFLSTRWNLAACAAVLEETGASRSLGRSWILTRGYFWRVLVTSFAVNVIVLLISGMPETFLVLGMEFMSVSPELGQLISEAVSQIGAILTLPISAAVTTLLYYDLRIRKEGYDLELAARQAAYPTTESV